MAEASITIDQYQAVIDALSQCDSNHSKAANLLGISRGAFQNRLSRGKLLYGEIEVPKAGNRDLDALLEFGSPTAEERGLIEMLRDCNGTIGDLAEDMAMPVQR